MAKTKSIIGDLRQRITVQSRTLQGNGYGEQVEVWTDLVSCWAAVEYPMADTGEEVTGGIQVGVLRSTFRIHYREGITELNKIVYKGDNYDIDSVKTAPEMDFLLISALRRK